MPALTDKDLADLPTLLELADTVGLSFVQDPSDVARLLDEVERLSDGHHSIVLRIETEADVDQQRGDNRRDVSVTHTCVIVIDP